MQTVYDRLGNKYQCYSSAELDGIDNCGSVVTCSVELKPEYNNDTFNGTLNECIDYCKSNKLTNDNAQIALIQCDKHGCVDFCYQMFDVNGDFV